MAIQTNVLIVPSVRRAISALQTGNLIGWLSGFSTRASFYNEGVCEPIEEFALQAMGQKRFLSIDRVANGGLWVEGLFESNGEVYRAFFNFELDDDGLICRLDVGDSEASV